jgi:glycosyltransferase involved in cell wall biosynthesis
MTADGRAPLSVALLKNLRFGDGPGGPLPYRIDHLHRHGIELTYTDLPYRSWARRLPDHVLQTVAMAPTIARCDVVLAMFESSAHPLGLLRHLVPVTRRSPMAVISCWLPEVLASADPARLDRYRSAYSSVDRLFCFSGNQTGLLASVLDLPPERVTALAFGVDHEEFTPAPASVEGHLLAVGRDLGRDWPTLLGALAATGAPARVLCRRQDLAGLEVPPNVEIVGHVDRATYRAELAAARAVLVVTHVLGYPTGQSVLLEAMSTGRPCIVTDSPAIADYVDPGRTALTVPPHDIDALAEVVRAVTADELPLDEIGVAARADVEARFTAVGMWTTVAGALHALHANAEGPR